MAGKIEITLGFNDAAEYVVALSPAAQKHFNSEEFNSLWTIEQTENFVRENLLQGLTATVRHPVDEQHPGGHISCIEGQHLKAA